MEEVSQRYKEGFNNGYLLAKHEPQLAAQILKSANDHSDYCKAMNAGKQEFEKEKNLERKTQPAKDIEKDKDIERDM